VTRRAEDWRVTQVPPELDLEEFISGPAEARTLAATVAGRLRSLILSGQLPPGSSLRLGPLAASLGISVMPVRDALQRLEADGLVVVTPRRGTVVAELSVEDAEEIYALRVALEALCARQAAEHLTDLDVAGLERLFRAMEEAHESGDLEGFMDRDQAFHARLYALSGRPRIMRMISALQDRSRRYLPHLYKSREVVGNPVEAHEPLLAAIQAREPELVERLTREHMNLAADRILRVVREEAEVRRVARAGLQRPVDGPRPRSRMASTTAHATIPGV
jgi:DNA-binding GntR family transcriptional regulator